MGCGDLSSSTAAGRIFSISYIFVGLGVVFGFVNAVAERSLARRGEKRDRRRRREGDRG